MEIISTLAASLSALASLGVLAFVLKLVHAYRQLHQDEASYLKIRLDGAEKDRDALLDKLKYVGTKESHGADSSNNVDKKRLFISTPIRGFDDAELIRFVDEVSRMIDAMSATRRFDGIFYEMHIPGDRDRDFRANVTGDSGAT